MYKRGAQEQMQNHVFDVPCLKKRAEAYYTKPSEKYSPATIMLNGL